MTVIEQRNKLEEDTKVQIKDEFGINQSFYTDGETRINCIEFYYFDQCFVVLPKDEAEKLIEALQKLVKEL
jgi:hypothetical protein